ncbi:hypothetical protein QFZ87_001448 [Bacillus sp. SLBN-46]|jgi:hypothetical protein|nr:hypothetical protein [Bacillus sp. SLBN-46]MDR6121851.1 hypothetical protein [Bacillus sp. SLBN-46]
MNKKNEFPTQKELDEAFHFLHDQINRISVVEEVEMIKEDKDNLKG